MVIVPQYKIKTIYNDNPKYFAKNAICKSLTLNISKIDVAIPDDDENLTLISCDYETLRNYISFDVLKNSQIKIPDYIYVKVLKSSEDKNINGSRPSGYLDSINDESISFADLVDYKVESIDLHGFKNIKNILIAGNTYVKFLDLSETSITELSVQGCKSIQSVKGIEYVDINGGCNVLCMGFFFIMFLFLSYNKFSSRL